MIEIDHIDLVKDYVGEDHTYVFLNVGRTLFTPSSHLSDYQFRQYFTKRVEELIQDAEQANALVDKVKALIVENIPKEASEKSTASVVADLQENKAIVFGLTRRSFSTSYAPENGKIISKHLNSLGIDLTLTYSYYPAEEYNEKYAFQYAILFTNKDFAGKAIVDFILKQSVLPLRIVVVNDSKKDLEEIAKSLEPFGIEFIGLRYSKNDSLKKAFDLDLAIIEFMAYIHEGKLLTNEEAKNLRSSTDYKILLDDWIINSFYTI